MGIKVSALEEKIIHSSIRLKVSMPYYSIVFTCMEKECDDEIETVGVSEDTIVYNSKFIESISFEELNFVTMHEIAHVALKHVTRMKGKDKKLWNIAADMIANKFIVDELSNTKGAKIIGRREYEKFGPGKTIEVNATRFKFLPGAIYCSSVDLEVDTVESIYNELVRQGNQNGYFKAKNSLLGGQGNNGDDSQGSDVEGFSFSFKGSGNSTGDDGFGQFNFKILKPDIHYVAGGKYSDLLDDGSCKEESEQKANRLLNRVKVKAQLDSNCTNYGVVPSNLEIEIGKALESEFDWKKYVMKYCIKLTSKDCSFRQPDKRMMYQSAIYPGQMGEESNALHNIKVCIDTSGSISGEDLRYFMGQLKSLLNQFKVDAELIYWDAEVESTGNFESYEELKLTKATGGGGTDVSCVFDYLKSKKCKIKPALTIIFTDGYFGNNFETQCNKRSFKDTLWIMSKNGDRNFKPAFGKVGKPKYPET